jgi:hypothetical protein
VPGFDLLQQLASLGGGNEIANRVGQFVDSQGEGQVVTRKVNPGIGCFVLPAKTLLFDRLDPADTVLWVVNAFTFSNIDGDYPLNAELTYIIQRVSVIQLCPFVKITIAGRRPNALPGPGAGP